MRGLTAHSNGFHSIRALSILMSLLGTIDRPGGFRHVAPYMRGTPPISIYARNPTGPEAVKPNTPLAGAPLGFPAGPEDLFVDGEGRPMRIDKAFAWEHPLSVHGMMHIVIANAVRGDPYPIDTLLGSASGHTFATALAAAFEPGQAPTLAVWAIVLTAAAALARIASLGRNSRIRYRSTLQTAIGVRDPRVAQKPKASWAVPSTRANFFTAKACRWGRG
jgi:anaerobic selenocysteine-containing dehydrogenase